MQRILIRESGIVATLFLPKASNPLPLIVTLGGFRGGLQEERAERLSAHGFASLALAYFGCEHLPPFLREIPLDYCERAIDWVKCQPSLDPNRIALWGVSRGAELALLLGSVIPKKIQAIVATVPTSAIYGAIQSDAPAWIYRGETLQPSAPLPIIHVSPGQGSGPETALALTPFFLEGMKEKDGFIASQIPVEKIQCPLLLISGGDDQMWPSSLFAQQIIERLREKGSSISCEHFCYPGAGHAFSSSVDAGETELHPIVKIWFAFGGNPRDNAFARSDSWDKTVRFFQKMLSHQMVI